MTLNEVAPPGWGHTKAEKEKTKPDKPKSKIGGTAAAFKRALDDGRFKGLPGSTTKKEKTADMFKLMYSMKKKGAKPHYKPGTDKKYKKYQTEGSLHKWFKGSKSKDGKAGWVNVKTGGTCASDEPGEGTPKCVSSAKRASMTKAERDSASRRKKAADPNQQSKSGAAKPTYVRTDSKKKMKEETSMQDNNLYGDAYAGLKKKIGSKKKHNKPAVEESIMQMIRGKKKEEKKPEKAMDAGARAKRKLARKVHAKYVSGSTENVPDNIREDKVLKTIAKELDGASKMHKGQANKIRKHLKDMKKGGDKKEHDCASKVKHEEYGIGNCIPEHHTILEDGTVSHYDVEFEEYIVENCPVEDLEILVSETHSHSPMKEAKEPKNCGCGQDPCITYGKKKKVDEACWKGYKAYGLKKKGNRMVPNCKPVGSVKKEERGYQPEIEHSKMGDAKKKADKKRESSLPPHLQGDAIGKMKKAFAEEDKKGKGSGTKDACYHKVKASAKVWPSAYASGRLVQCRKKGAANYGKSKSEGFEGWADNAILEKTAAWTRKAGKNKEGGLNEKGRKSYEKANPGSDLKAPQPEGGSRKKSFCARMGGMKKKLTSAKTANDPDSRINKALRKWKC